MTEGKSEKVGIAGLPKIWAVAVQLVGTFGLAVFLVLYYVLVLQPAEAERYDKLATAVNELLAVVRADQTLLSRPQVEALQELFVQAAAPAVAQVLLAARAAGRSEGNLEREITNQMMLRVDLFKGLKREDGDVLAGHLQNMILNRELPQRLAALATGEWREMPGGEVTLQTTELMRSAVRAAARAK